MKKMFKIIAMLLVITTVVFAAGCASKTAEPATTEETSGDGLAEAPNTTVGNDNITVNATNDTNVTANVTNFTDNDTNFTANVTE